MVKAARKPSSDLGGVGNTPPVKSSSSSSSSSRIFMFDTEAISVSLAWVSCTFILKSAYEVATKVALIQAAYADLTGVSWSQTSSGRVGYSICIQASDNAFLAFSLDRKDFTLCISQSVLEKYTPDMHLHFLDVCIAFGGRFSRIDINADDFALDLQPARIWSVVDSEPIIHTASTENGLAYRHPYIVGRFRTWSYYSSKGMPGAKKVGDTCYIGSRSSSVYLRFYDAKGAGHYSEECTRFEAEFKYLKADAVARFLLLAATERYADNSESEPFCLEDYAQALFATLIGTIEFRDLSEHQNYRYCSRLDWWAKFCSKSDKVVTRPKITASSLVRICTWLEYSVATTIATAYHAHRDQFGEEGAIHWLNSLIAAGFAKFTAKNQSMIDEKHLLSDPFFNSHKWFKWEND